MVTSLAGDDARRGQTMALRRCVRGGALVKLNSYGAICVVGVERHLLKAHCIIRHMFYSLGIKMILIGSQGLPSLGAAFVGLTDHSSSAAL
jgi:hypothetical protein